MNIHIHRHRIGETASDGTLRIDGLRICDTAEHSQYRVPAGTYRIVLKWNRAHRRKVPTLEPLKPLPRQMPSAPCLCIGNGIYSSHDGRILLGTYIAPGCLKCSREPFMQLYHRINNSMRRGNEVFLSIKETL